MNTRKHPKDKTSSATAAPKPSRSFLRAEWPLLLVPALILAALALLPVAKRALEHELAPSHDSQGNASQLDPNGAAANTAAPGQDLLPGQRPQAQTPTKPRPGQPGVLPPHLANRLKGSGGSGLAANATLRDALRQALQAQDHAKIKEIMRDLVALGDDAVAQLNDIITNSKDETAVWAAEALARIGTPAATTVLLDTLDFVEDGPYKEELAKRVANISNHDSWTLLLDAVQGNDDPYVQRAAAKSLAGMADTAVIDEIVARYDAAQTEEEREQLAQIISNINAPEASASLRTLAGDVSSPPQNSIQKAAVDAMANTGDPQSVSYLMRKLEASPPGQGGYVFEAITTIDQPEAKAALLYAAAGNKEVSAEGGQAAAIYALENYPTEETCRLLQEIVAGEGNAAVVTAAARTLDNIRKTTPTITETTTSKADTGSMLSVNPLKK